MCLTQIDPVPAVQAYEVRTLWKAFFKTDDDMPAPLIQEYQRPFELGKWQSCLENHYTQFSLYAKEISAFYPTGFHHCLTREDTIKLLNDLGWDKDEGYYICQVQAYGIHTTGVQQGNYHEDASEIVKVPVYVSFFMCILRSNWDQREHIQWPPS